MHLSYTVHLVVLTVLLVACGQAPVASPERPLTLSYAFPADPASRASAEALRQGFAAVEPGITLDLQPLPADTYPQVLLDRMTAGNGPDLFTSTDVQVPMLASQGALLDLAPLEVTPGDISPAALEPWQVGDKLLGLPQHAVPLVLFYNRDLFDAANVPYPSASWTWDDWRATARQLTDPASGVFGTSIDGWGQLVWGNGGDILNAGRTQTLLDQPAAAEGVQFGADMINIDKSAPLHPVAGGPDPVELFRAGKLAMLPVPSSFMDVLQRESPGFEWDIAPVPARATRVTQLAVTGIAASANTPYPAEAARFIAWATGPEGLAADISAFPFAAPARPSVAPAEMFTGASELSGEKYVVEGLTYGRVLPYVEEWPTIADIVNQALVPVWKGEQSAAAAYREVAPKINALLGAG